jgi:hypothetical protein
MNFRKALVAFVPAIVAMVGAGSAHAANTDCFTKDGTGKVTLDDASGTPFTAIPIYVAGSTALEPLLKAIGPALAAAPTPYVIVYEKMLGSCGGAGLFGAGTGGANNPIASATPMFYVPKGANGTANAACTQPATPISPQATVVLSDVDAKLCSITLPTGVNDFHGPVNDMVLVVPNDSFTMNKAISAEQAYLAFGLGAAGMAEPWTDPTALIIRSKSSGTRAMINANIGVGTHDWQGINPPAGSSGEVLTKVTANNGTAAALKTLGILGEDFYDSSTNGTSNRNSLKALAFRAFKQMKAYWPDSTSTSRDRRNVREGRYPIWGYVHMLANVTGTMATDPAAQYFIDVVQGNLQSSPVDILTLTVNSHLTPTCAMKVTHDIEGGKQMPYTPAAPCGCAFDTKVAGTAPASCMACTADADCTGSAKHCRFGYCEAN